MEASSRECAGCGADTTEGFSPDEAVEAFNQIDDTSKVYGLNCCWTLMELMGADRAYKTECGRDLYNFYPVAHPGDLQRDKPGTGRA